MKNKTLLILSFLPIFVFGQVKDSITSEPSYITDGAYEKQLNQNKNSAFQYPEINEKDIVWSRTIWRVIDMKEKMNHHFYFPLWIPACGKQVSDNL